MAITPLPTPPSRENAETFSADADAFLDALPTFATQANILAADVNAKQAAAAINANVADAASLAAQQTAGVTAWVSGTTYAIGVTRYDTTNYLTYRRKTAGAGTTRPGLDSTNWQLLTGLGDVNTADNQTIAGTKTFSSTIQGNISGTAQNVTGIVAVANGGTGANTLAAGGYLKGAGPDAVTSQSGIPAADISSGTVATARLGGNTANNTTFLRGDQTWSGVFGAGQTWQVVTRSTDTWYQNTTGRPIGVYAYGSIGGGISWDVGVSTTVYVTISMSDGDSGDSADYGWIVVPDGHYYRNTGSWNNPRELR